MVHASATPMYAFQSPSVSSENGAYRMGPPRSSRSEPSLHSSSEPFSRVYLHVPYRRTRRLAILVALLACGTFASFALAYWLFTTRYSHIFPSLTRWADSDPSHQDPTIRHQYDIHLNTLDETDTRLNTLRDDPTVTYLAYLPHSGLHNQRIALENALTLARLLNRTLLVPPARLGPNTLRYVRSSTLARMIRLSDKRQGLLHCSHIPPDIPPPGECMDYMTYTLVPWAWLVDMEPITAQQVLVYTSNGTVTWIEEQLGIYPNETRFLPDAEPYEYQFVDTPAPAREGAKYLHAVSIDTLAAMPERLIQLGTLFGSSRLRLRKPANRWLRGEVRRHMVFGNMAVTLAAKNVGNALGGTYVAAHVRVGDGRFQKGARRNVRLVWWKLVRDVVGLDTHTALQLERRVLTEMSRVVMVADGAYQDNENDNDEAVDINETFGPPEIPTDMASLRVPHPPLPPLPDAFYPKCPCRNRLHTAPSLRRLNVPLFIATDALDGLHDPLLEPLIRTFPCTFSLGSFEAETAHLEGLRNGYDGVLLARYMSPIVDASVMGRAWAVVGTEGSTFSRYVGDVLWRLSHGWEIVQRG